MKKNFASVATPKSSQGWKKKTEKNRIEIITKELKKNILFKNFSVIRVPDDGQIVLKINQVIPANERGLLLLKLEEILKSTVDRGITVWCEPVGDKSKLRQLRGVKIITKN